MQGDQPVRACRCDHVTPGRARLHLSRARVRVDGDAEQRALRSRIVSARSPRLVAPCPVLCGATRRSFAAAKRTVAVTSSGVAASTTSAGY
jgi:hypothetical protein